MSITAIKTGTRYRALPGCTAMVHYAGSGRWKPEYLDGRQFCYSHHSIERPGYVCLWESGGVCLEVQVLVSDRMFEELMVEVERS